MSRLIEGGYPALRTVPAPTRRRLFNDYVSSTILRDLREISDARKLDEMPRLLRRLGSQAANLYVPENVSHDLKLTRPTVVNYTALLKTVFLVHTLPAWRPGIGSREVQHEKLHFVDTGLLANLLGADETRVEVKSHSHVAPKDWRAMAKLRDQRKEQFKAGIVICTGAQTLPLSERIWAVPVSALWS